MSKYINADKLKEELGKQREFKDNEYCKGINAMLDTALMIIHNFALGDEICDKGEKQVSNGECGEIVCHCNVKENAELIAKIMDYDVVEIKHGEWIDYDDDYGSLMCSICDKDAPDDIPWDFCPHCGADMRGKTE